MSRNARLLLSAIGVVAVAATPAMAKTQHARTSRNQTEQVAPPVVAPAGPYNYVTGYRLPRDYHRYDGYQQDRQVVGIND